jgi:hypothetical protein
MRFDCPEHEKTRVREAGKASLATKGKRKGYLLSRCPESNSDAAIFWQSAMLVFNPFKASIAARLFWNEEQRQFAQWCEAYCEALARQGVCLDLDRVQLQRMGAW